MWPIERLRAELTRQHVSQTKARDKVYVTLAKLGPCRISEVVQALNDRHNQTTVHRTIKLFLKLGIATRPDYELVELSPPFLQHHHHITCPQCGHKTGFLDEKLEARIEKIITSRRLALSGHQIELQAVCEKCLLLKPKNR